MQYHVAKNGEKFGPFDQSEVYRRLVAGELSGSALGWHEGLAEWAPLSTLIPPPSPQAASSFGAASSVFGTFAAQPAAVALPAGTSGLAIASLVAGILGFVTLGLGGIVAVITGHLALSEIKRSLGKLGGKGMAIAGLILGYLGVLSLAIVAAIAIASLSTVQSKAQITRVKSDLQAIKIALQSYESRALILPTTEQGLRALVDKPSIEPIPARWRALMQEVPTDPWGHEYRYRFPAQKSAQAFDLFSLGPDGVEGGEDDITNG